MISPYSDYHYHKAIRKMKKEQKTTEPPKEELCYLDNPRNKYFDAGDKLYRCPKCKCATGVIDYFQAGEKDEICKQKKG